ncbi:hypothetical protein PV783_25020 [Chitinophaga sp. CC14]|uniref:hypothetical protein n=1 Tax=Chitinophaga sp. CC14 TaxID=3029199 RepID=UPI003B8114B6
MAHTINRVHEALAEWKRMEENNINMFPPVVMNSPEFAKIRLKHLDEVAAKLSLTAGKAEKESLRILAIERRQLVRTAYPKGQGFRKFIFRITRPFRFMIGQHAELRRQDQQLARIQTHMQKAGFGKYVSAVFKKIRQGERSFSLPTSAEIRQNDQVHFNLQFSFDEARGHSFDGFQAGYRNSLKPGEVRQHTFSTDEAGIVHAERATHLIAGRAILETVSQNGHVSQQWVKLDTRKDEQGNFLMKYISAESFDTRKHCEGLPFWRRMNQFDQLRAIGNLISGERAPVNIELQGKKIPMLIEADPEKGMVRLLDEKGKSVDPNKLETKQVMSSGSTLKRATGDNKLLTGKDVVDNRTLGLYLAQFYAPETTKQSITAPEKKVSNGKAPPKYRNKQSKKAANGKKTKVPH